MKLTIHQYFHAIPGDYVEIKMILDDGKTQHGISEILPNELCKNKEIMGRTIDKMYYEMRKMIDKHLEQSEAK